MVIIAFGFTGSTGYYQLVVLAVKKSFPYFDLAELIIPFDYFF